MRPLRVLLVDDSEADALLTLRELKKSYKVEYRQVWTPETVREALRETWDIVVSDWSMPKGFTGLSAFEIVRELEIDIPFIIVSGTINEDIAVDALKAGVHDFMAKGRFARLMPTIERELREVDVRRRQRRADAELAASERLMRDVLDSVPDAVVVADAEGKLVMSNAPARALGGLDTHLPSTLAPALAGQAVDRQEQFWPTLHEGGGWMSASARPLHDRGAVVVYRDMTQERRAQEQLMVSDRMASIGMLAAGVAHEINNPLAAVLANVDLALGELDALGIDPSAEIREMLADAKQAGARVRDIVRDLKLFSRHQEADAMSVDLDALLESTLRMAWNEIRHRARLEKAFEVTPYVRGSESRLGQVFLNLIINAAQAIPEGDAANNTIRIAKHTNDSGDAVVAISDTGSGIAPEVLRHLFTPFYTTKPLGVGTGLGLAISHRIVTNLGGAIDVESTPGRGTTFRITLPSADDAPVVAAMPAPRPQTSRRGRVLVIDDEPLITSVVARTLPEHDIVTRTSSTSALQLIRDGERFDVILCDLMMPQITGMELHEQVRAIDPAIAETIVFMTGDAFTEAARAFVATVPNRILDKPFEPRELRALIADRVK
jgi:signal transduction histidine kinase